MLIHRAVRFEQRRCRSLAYAKDTDFASNIKLSTLLEKKGEEITTTALGSHNHRTATGGDKDINIMGRCRNTVIMVVRHNSITNLSFISKKLITAVAFRSNKYT